jgi:hypothetical protein
MGGDVVTEMFRRKSGICRGFHRISTPRAPAPKEAWLAIEKGPYLLGFSQWAGDWQNRRCTSNAPAHHVKKALFAGIYGANRDRTGDLLLAKQALSQLSYGPATSQYTRYGADSRCAAAGRHSDLNAVARTIDVVHRLARGTAHAR